MVRNAWRLLECWFGIGTDIKRESDNISYKTVVRSITMALFTVCSKNSGATYIGMLLVFSAMFFGVFINMHYCTTTQFKISVFVTHFKKCCWYALNSISGITGLNSTISLKYCGY